MNSKIPDCPSCSKNYDLVVRSPKMLPKCGHTICLKCLTLILANSEPAKCPIDSESLPYNKKTAADFPSNVVLTQIISDFSQQEKCQEHGEEKRLVCFTDRTKICNDCGLFGKHKGHIIEPLKVIHQKISKKKQKLEEIQDNIKDHLEELLKVAEESRETFTKMIQASFQDIQRLAQAKELQLISEANSFFKIQKEQIQQNFGNSSTLDNEFLKKMAQYREFSSNEELFRLLEENIDLFILKISPEELSTNLIKLKQDFSISVNVLHKSFLLQSQTLSSLKLPNDQLQEAGFRYLDNYQGQTLISNFRPEKQRLVVKNTLEFEMKGDTLTIKLQRKEPQETSLNLKGIEKIELVVNKEELIEEDFTNLLETFKAIPKVSSLLISDHFKALTDKGLINLLISCLSRAVELNSFEIRLPRCKSIGDKGISYFLNDFLPKMTNLQSLTIGLRDTSVTDRAFLSQPHYPLITSEKKNLARESGLPSLQNLESLMIFLEGTSVTNNGAIKLFRNGKKLKKMIVSLKRTQVTEEFRNEIACTFLPAAVHLQEFKVCLTNLTVDQEDLSRAREETVQG